MRHRAELAADARRDGHARSFSQACRLGLDDALERPSQEARRLERVGELAQHAIDFFDPPVERAQVASRRLACPGLELGTKPAEVGCQGCDVLQGAVVEIESESGKSSLTGRYE